MKAVIMAGGKGTRLKPLTLNTPKPMVPVLNKPVMSYAIELLRKHEIFDIAVTVQYLPDKIRDFFGDGSALGVNLKYFEEFTPLGTAGSVRNASDFLDETFLVISGDGITDYDLSRAVEFHRTKGGIATMVMAKVQNPLEYGVIMCNQENKIVRFLEKPGWGEVFSDTVNTGIYILEPEIFEFYERDVFFDFSKNLFPLLLKQGKSLYGYTASGYWSDIGSLEQYRQTHYDILNGLINVDIAGTKVREGLWVGSNTVIEPGTEIRTPAYIGNNCVIDSAASVGEFTVIGDNNVIGAGASLRRSIIWADNEVSPGALVDGVTVCQDTRIRQNSVLLEGSVIGDLVEIGSGVTVQPRVRVWPECKVIDDTVLNTSLIFCKANKVTLFSGNGVKGEVNTEITPELASKLAVAFGSVLPCGESVVLGSDGTRAALALKKVMTAGLVATGLNVLDIGTSVTPVTRYAVKSLEAYGAIHIRVDTKNEAQVFVLEFLDRRGINISKDFERKIENAIDYEEFRRIGPEAFGEIHCIPQIAESYWDGLLATVDHDMIKRFRFRLLVAYDFSRLGWLVPHLLQKLDCRVKTVDLADYQSKDLYSLATDEMDLGVVFSSNADTITLFTPEGEVVEKERLLALWSFIAMDQAPGTTFGVPVNATSIIDRIAADKGGKVIRTKCAPSSVMEVSGDSMFQPLFDGIYVFIKVLEYLETKNCTINSILTLIPQTFTVRRSVPCPFSQKGAVMRKLLDVLKTERLELLDGIKIYNDKGWALVLPDSEEPVFSVTIEADSYESAEEIAAFCKCQIEKCQAGE